MTLRRISNALGLLAATVALALAVSGPATAQDSGSRDVLRVGWSQDPKTLNPFVGVNEEEFAIWAINWELLVGFSPEDLTPAPAIAESWDVSEDGRTVTYHLIEDAVWSDGEPITSADVKWSLETLGSEGLLFSGYTDGVTAIETPDDHTVVLEDEAAQRPAHRRPLRLHPAGARLGQGAGR